MPPKRTITSVSREVDEMKRMMEQQAVLLNLLIERLDQPEVPPPPRGDTPPPVDDVPQQTQDPDPFTRHRVPMPPVPNVPVEARPIQAPIVGEPAYERFRRQQPPIFDGSLDPMVAGDWIRKIQKIFDFMRLTDEERIACAANQLEKSAGY